MMMNTAARTSFSSLPSTLFNNNAIGGARFMSKYLSKAAKKRIPLCTKRAGKGFYKGNGCTKEGRLTSKAKFMVDPFKQLKLVVPEGLDSFPLKPYIASTASRYPPEDRHTPVS